MIDIPRAWAASGIVSPPKYRYMNLLGRPAEPAGERTYLAALQAGQFTPTAITTRFLASDEFLAHAIALAGG